MLDLRLYANHLEGLTFKTKISKAGFQGEVHVWNNVREFTIEKVYQHHVLCRRYCEGEGEGNEYRESFHVADLESFGVIDQIRRKMP